MHPYRHIEFYEHDWRYFKKYWRKDVTIEQKLIKLEKGAKWDEIKQIIGKKELTEGDEQTKELNRDFVELKKEYWQVWDEMLQAMEQKGKVFEINLSSFYPQKEFYCTLLEQAAKYKKLNFSIAYDFHTLEQRQPQDIVVGVPGVKNPGRAARIQSLLDLIDLLGELGIDKSRIINSSEERLEKFIEQRDEKRKLHYLEKSEDKNWGDIKLMSQKLNQTVVKLEIEQLVQRRGGINKLLIKYETAEGKKIYVKKDSNYDMKKIYGLMKLMNQEMPDKTNEVIGLDRQEAIIYKSLEGGQLREIMAGGGKKELAVSAVKSADLIYGFHNLDPAKFKDYINDKNYNLKEVRFLAGRDLVGEIGQYDNETAAELTSLYQELVNFEEEILRESKLVLIHGDFHPGNVLVDDKDNIKLIDYKNLTMGVKERDLASMLEQVYAQVYLGKSKMEKESLFKWQELFLKAYKGRVDKKKLIFYQAWISWRNAIYCFSKYFLGKRDEADVKNGKLFMENVKRYLKKYKEEKN